MTKTIEQIQQDIKQIRANPKDKKVLSIPKKVVEPLPFWPEPTRGVPSFMFRSAIFAAIQSRDRKFFKKLTKISSLQDFDIWMKGEQLNQEDLDVFAELMHMISRENEITDGCRFNGHELLKRLGRSTGGDEHDWLQACIIRLCSAFIQLNFTNKTEVFGVLLNGGFRDMKNYQYIIHCNPKMRDLYDFGWTKECWAERQALKKAPLALWLSGWFASHAEVLPMTVERYKELSGSNNGEIRDFKRHLMRALEKLKAKHIITDFFIDGGQLFVEKNASKAQRLHLKKKKAAAALKSPS